MKNITILGGGVLGSQIAFQTSYSGYNVTIYLRSKESIKRCKKKLEEVKNSYIEAINIMKKNKDINNWSLGIEDFDNFNASKCLKKVNMVLDEIKLELNLDKALKDTDLVIESMSEDFNAKKEIYESACRRPAYPIPASRGKCPRPGTSASRRRFGTADSGWSSTSSVRCAITC